MPENGNVTAKGKGRLNWIDSIKGIAIIAVVLGHVLLGFADNDLYPAYQNFYIPLKNWIYTWHMPVFMLLSGFTFALSCCRFKEDGSADANWKKIKNKMINLLLIYVIFQVCMVCLKMVFSAFVDNTLTVKSAMMNIFFPDMLMWYIWVLFFYYLIFGFIVKLKVDGRILLGVMIVISIAAYWVDSVVNIRLCFEKLLFLLPFFYGGMMIQKRLNSTGSIRLGGGGIRKLLCIVYSAAYFVALVVFRVCDISIHAVFAGILGLLNALAITILLIGFLEKRANGGFISKIGRQSLVIYLLHTYLVTAIKAVIIRTGFGNFFIAALAAWIIPLVITYVIAVIADKVKWIGYIFSPIKFLKDFKLVKD